MKHAIAELVAEPTLGNIESDHRIANHLAMLASYVRLKGSELARRETPPDTSDIGYLIRGIVAQMDAISDLHRILSAQGTPNAMDLSVPLSRICAAMQTGVAGEVNIVGSFENGCELAPRAILPVTQICAEVITNAIKHGCNSDGQGNIRVSCGKTSAGTILVEISDNGQGQTCNRHAIGANGLGLRLIDALVQQVDGRMEYLSSAQGLTVRLRLPAALM